MTSPMESLHSHRPKCHEISWFTVQETGRYAFRRASSSSEKRQVIQSTSCSFLFIPTSFVFGISNEEEIGGSLVISGGKGIECAWNLCLCKAANEGCKFGRAISS